MTWSIEGGRIAILDGNKVLPRSVHHPHCGAVYRAVACLFVDPASERSAGSGHAPVHSRGKGWAGCSQEIAGFNGTRRHERNYAFATPPDSSRHTESQRDLWPS